MSSKQGLTRRSALKVGACGVVGMAASGCDGDSAEAGAAGAAAVSRPASEHYYTAGAFDAKKALQAYFDMMQRFHYPIPEVLKTDQLWTCDFLQKDFANLGMAGIFWVNASGVYGTSGAGRYQGAFKEQPFGYLGHEIYLLPGQALPEHNHYGGPEGHGPKMESWQVRYGSVEFFGEYKATGEETLISDMPAEERPWGFGEDWFKCKYVVRRTAASGRLYSLDDAESYHFQRAGAEGAIVTEYATYHNDVQFSKPGMAFDSTKATA